MDLGGIKFMRDVDEAGKEKEVKVGDLYIAERNTGPKLLTAAKLCEPSEGVWGGNWIQPTTIDYPYNTWECVKIVEVT